MNTQLSLAVQLVLAAILMWTCFCRLVKTDSETYREVRWAILLEGVAAGMVFGAPILPLLMPREIHWRPWTTPTWVWLTLLVAVTLVQLVTARYWTGGKAPQAFQRAGAANAIPPGGAVFAALLLLVGLLASGGHALAQAPQWQRADVFTIAAGSTGRVSCEDADGCVLITHTALARMLEQASQQAPCRGTAL